MRDVQRSTSLGVNSDITGRKLKLAEPFIKMKNFHVGTDEIEKVHNLIKNNKGDYSETCSVCRDDKSRTMIESKNPKHEKFLYLCEDCSERISERLEESREYIDETTYHWDESGVIIFKKSEEDRNYTDVIEKNTIKNNIVIGLPINLGYHLQTRLSNIRELIELIKHGGNYSSRAKLCEKCGSGADTTPIENFYLCWRCRDDIVRELEEFEQENSDMIVASTI